MAKGIRSQAKELCKPRKGEEPDYEPWQRLDITRIQADVKVQLAPKPRRLAHTLSVARTAEHLALLYDVDPYLARIAGLLHDWDKVVPRDELIARAHRLGIDLGVPLQSVEPLLHGMVAARELPDRYPHIPTEVWQAYIPDFLDWWYENHIDMDLDVWSYWSGRRDSNRVRILPDLFSRGEDDRARSCHESSNRFFIDADGRMVRCIALSGITAAYGIKCPNVYKGDDLQQVMTQSNFLDALTCTCGALKAALPDCQACRWRERCGMGCRAEAMAQCGSTAGIDHRMCAFYNDGCYVKLKAVAEKHELTLYPTQ